jgi:hypothetical protein
VGICQKNPSFLSDSITTNQIESARKLSETITVRLSEEQKEQSKPIEFVFDFYCSPNGSETYLFAL